MSFVSDPVLNLVLAPSMKRAVDILELEFHMMDARVHTKDPKADTPLSQEILDDWRRKVQRVAEGQTFMPVDDFLDEALDITFARRERRNEIARDKWLKKQRDLAQIKGAILAAPAPVDMNQFA